MALSRKLLSALGIEADKIEQIIEAHTETVNALKNERDTFRENAEKYDAVQKELDAANKKIESFESDGGKDKYKVKYEALKEEYEDYKKGIEAEKTKAEKESLFTELLKEIGISEKRIKSVVKVSDLDTLNIEDGKLKDLDTLRKSLKEEWADFITTESKQGAETKTPPEGDKPNAFESMTLSEKMEYANAHPTDEAVRNYLK